MIKHLPKFITRNFQFKLIAVLVACGMWVGVVYASDPPAITTFNVQVQNAGILHAGLVLLRPIGTVPVKIAGVSSDVRSQQAHTHLTAFADLGGITKVGRYEVPLKVEESDPNVWIWSAPEKVLVLVDRQATLSIPVHLNITASPPSGYVVNVGRSTITPADVTVTGPATLLPRLQAEANVNLTSIRTSLSFTEPVRLLNNPEPASTVTVSPKDVTVAVAIDSETSERALPVIPTFAGAGEPPSGYTVTGIVVDPLTVIVTGPASTLASLTSVSTQPIDIAHTTSSEAVTEQVLAPGGTTLSLSYVTVVITITPVASPTPSPTPTPTPTS
ncbi:MAG: CdaR family protein [Candidatus Dormiibacterota bacterium]|jgi:YbbR domain-containing protein